MPSNFAEGLCPVCNGRLAKKLVDVREVVVPDGHKDAVWTGRGEVVRRSAIYPATVNGVREIVQDLRVWQGGFDSPWAPFCTVQCGARFGVDAWANGYTGGTLARLPQPTAVDRRVLAADFERLVEHVSEAPTLAFVEHQEQPPAPALKPGDEGWHPPGLPPPVPGEFKYGPSGRRISLNPEARAMRARNARIARETHLARQFTSEAATDAAKALRQLGRLGDAPSIPPPTPEVIAASNDPLVDGSRSMTEARMYRLRQLWPDLRFPLSTICNELNKLPGRPISGASSMTNLASSIGLPTRRFDAYGGR